MHSEEHVSRIQVVGLPACRILWRDNIGSLYENCGFQWEENGFVGEKVIVFKQESHGI